MSIGTSIIKIWIARSCEFKPNFLIFLCLYHLSFDLETKGGWLNHQLMKKAKSIWIQVLSYYNCNRNSSPNDLYTLTLVDILIMSKY